MTGRTVLILGGGWGGLTAAHHLRSLLPDEHRVVVVERSDTFTLGVSHMWLMTGEREALGDVTREMQNLKRPGIEWIRADAQRIDPDTRTVETDDGPLMGDYLVIALGAQLAPETVPGFSDAAHNLYDPAGAEELGKALQAFDRGRIVVLVAGAPFRCPAAPYEAAMLAEWLTRERGIRDRCSVSLFTPEAKPMAVAGPAVGDALEEMLGERGIDYHPEHKVTAIEPESKTLQFGEESVSFDLLIGVPPHRAPAIVAEAGLVDAMGYVPVHPQRLEILSDPDTLETRYPHVYAIGDVTAVRLLNSMLLPKAGVFAEGEAQIVASAIAADILGEPAPRGYDGNGFCYVEVGDGLAAHGSGDFYAYPGPRVRLEAPSTQSRKAKEEYEVLLETWFD
ncbi:MAG: NAD(P)/FAD-dependent oxidoreductase [Acidimicrobiia bacterium]|nr:NAD(P)/FAD-dependent oxidoreductase [Acidimicrobiia bacterium]